MRFFIAVLMILMCGIPAYPFDREVRDRNGRLLYRDHQAGDRLERRDRHGILLEQETRRGNAIYVRDRHGRLLRIERFKGGK